MIRHMLAFRFKADVGQAQRDAVLAELETFPSVHPRMREFRLGQNISDRDTSMSHAFTMWFDTEDDLVGYLRSDEHEQFVRERWRPVIEQQVIATIRA